MVDEHDQGGGLPAVAGQVGLEDPFEEGDQRDAVLTGQREPGELVASELLGPRGPFGVLVAAAGGGEGGQVGAQQAGGEVGDPGVQVGGPVAAAAQGRPGGRGGSSFLVQEPLVVGLFGDVGGQVFEHPVTQDRQLTRTQSGRPR